MKKLRLSSPEGSKTSQSENLDKRKQVDAHVQAFLKAVLDRANGSVSKSKVVKDKKDAATQTDFVSDELSCDESVNISSIACPSNECLSQTVPNRAIYSQEALTYVSLKDVHNFQLQHEFSHASQNPAQYFTGLHTTTTFNGTGQVTPSDTPAAMAEWMQKYEQWFLQNFGMDAKAVPSSTFSTACPPLTTFGTTADLVTVLPAQTVSASNNQSAVVLSRPPVSYLVPEGSLYAPENTRFTPYFSLLPSFYSPAALGQGSSQVTFLGNTSTAATPTLNSVHPFQHFPGNFSGIPVVSHSVGQQSTVSLTSVNPPTLSEPVSLQTSIATHQTVAHTPTPFLGPTGTLPPSFADFSAELQASAVLAALSFPVSSGRQTNLCQWGPLLRYGTYGRLPSAAELEQLNKDVKSGAHGSTTESPSSKKMPPPPPTFILLRRQAMICSLQLSCRELSRDLFLREKESRSGLRVDYVQELESVVEKSISLKPIYLFTRLRDLPATEKVHFLPTSFELRNGTAYDGPRTTQPILGRAFSVQDMYICDLMIGDVLIAEACATFKRQAQLSVARQAFKLLSQPCFLVGSIRTWECVEYLVLCLSSKADLVPHLSPFLSDPFESLTKKDRSIRLDRPDECFEVVNPKPADDIWLFMAKLPMHVLDDDTYTDRILAQSAEFSQMTISFEVEVDTENGVFACSAILENERYPPVHSSSINEARELASKQLLSQLRETQPIVGIKSDAPDDPGSLWGVPENALVDTLMWGKEEKDLAVPIEHLEAHCEVPVLEASASELNSNSGNPYCSARFLENVLQAYAASALVTPLRLSSTVVPESLWALVRQLSTNWGLLSQPQPRPYRAQASSLLVCKRAPLPRLKRTLYDQNNYGCFKLLHKGALSSDALTRLQLSDPLFTTGESQMCPEDEVPPPSFSRLSPPSSPSFTEDPGHYSDDPLSRIARRFRATAPELATVKTEPSEPNKQTNVDDCVLVTAELNQPSTAIEILDDLPRTLIPGIDF